MSECDPWPLDDLFPWKVLAALIAAVQMIGVEGDDVKLQSEAMSEWTFMLVSFAVCTAIFLAGMIVGGWLSWTCLLQRSTTALDSTCKQTAPDAVSGRDRSVIVTPHGERFHLRASCFGLRSASATSTRSACLICALRDGVDRLFGW